MKSLSCPNTHRPPSKDGSTGAVIRHGFYRTRWGKRRYQCRTCGKKLKGRAKQQVSLEPPESSAA